MRRFVVLLTVEMVLDADNPDDAAKIARASVFHSPTNQENGVTCFTIDSVRIKTSGVFKAEDY